MEQQSLLSDMEFNPVLASPGKRFLNYLIDLFIFYVLFLSICFSIAFNESEPGTSSVTLSSSQVSIQLFGFVFYVIYFLLSEILFNGRTIGKLITGTKAINYDGTAPEPKIFLLRSLSRIVPFEPFSALGNPSRPWHDKWTNTIVIDVRKTEQNNAALQ